MDRMSGQNLPVLEYQKTARASAVQALDALQPSATRDLIAAFARTPALVSEAANGRTPGAIRAMQLEAEVRVNPELRADRFVQSWQQLQAQRGKLDGWENESARKKVEGRMKAMANGLEKDPALGAALAKRGSQLVGKQWSLEWTPGRRDGGIGGNLSDMARTRAVVSELTHSLERGRNLGMEL
jgi:ABC-type Fe2+-enterobactin transport system substrate-binding protein